LLLGHHDFVVLDAATADHATTMLSNLKAELAGNDLLLEDFPAAVYPIRALEGETRRCMGQLHHGQPTRIGWSSDQIVLPCIPGSASSGSLVRTYGITSAIRGAIHTRPDGSSVRPSLAILDDPQTDESARSLSQCATRLATIQGAVKGLAGPGRKTAMIAAMTVVAEGDLADQLLNRDLHPEWSGQRFKMLYAMPTNQALWDTYAETRSSELAAGGDGSAATRFYIDNREAMDVGAKVAWPARKLPEDASALQHAMNLKLADEAAFMAEYQNDPLAVQPGDDEQLDPVAVLGRTVSVERYLVPDGLNHVTAFIDIQRNSLWYVVCAWGQHFTGQVIDYGCWPEQNQSYYPLRSIRRTLEDAAPEAGLEASIRHGLEECSSLILDREYPRVDGATLRCERLMIDAAWGQSTETVYEVVRHHAHPTLVLPSFGRGVRASDNPMTEWGRKKGDVVGLNWRLRTPAGGVRYCAYDTNFWKSHVASRLTTPTGDPGALTIYSGDEQRHRMLAEHLTSEFRTRVQGRGRVVDEWRLRVGRDNHWLDGVVGCAVGASMLGVAAPGHKATPARTRPRRGPNLKLSFA
jgi:hypothetical protein